MKNLCACGCGLPVKKNIRKYLWGHYFKDKDVRDFRIALDELQEKRKNENRKILH